VLAAAHAFPPSANDNFRHWVCKPNTASSTWLVIALIRSPGSLGNMPRTGASTADGTTTTVVSALSKWPTTCGRAFASQAAAVSVTDLDAAAMKLRASRTLTQQISGWLYRLRPPPDGVGFDHVTTTA